MADFAALKKQGEERARQKFYICRAEARYSTTATGQRLITDLAHTCYRTLVVAKSDKRKLCRGLKLFSRCFPGLHAFAMFQVAAEMVLNWSFREGGVASIAGNLGKILEQEAMLIHGQIEGDVSREDVVDMLHSTLRTRKLRRNASSEYFNTPLSRNLSELCRAFRRFKKTYSWEPLPLRHRLEMATAVIGMLVDNGEVFEAALVPQVRHKRWEVRLTEEACKWLTGAEEYYATHVVASLPCWDPPFDWSDQYTGGYPGRSGHLIQSHAHETWPFNPECALLPAVNTLQRTPWLFDMEAAEFYLGYWQEGRPLPDGSLVRVDSIARWKKLVWNMQQLTRRKKRGGVVTRQEMAKALLELRLHHHNLGKMGLVLSFGSALRALIRECGEVPYYFDWRADFRGRMYQGGGVCRPQGSDSARAVWRFPVEDKPLGVQAEDYFLLHLSSLWGGDESRQSRILRIGGAMKRLALESRWQDAAEPFQYRRAVRDWRAGTWRGTPVALDAASHGLQLIGGLLSDDVLMRESNLLGETSWATPFDDLYTRLLPGVKHEMDNCWKPDSGWGIVGADRIARYQRTIRYADRLFDEMPLRKWVKTMVVAYIYGSRPTSQTNRFADTLREWMVEHTDYEVIADLLNTMSFLLANAVYKVLNRRYPGLKVYQHSARAWAKALLRKYGDRFEDLVVEMPSGFLFRPARFQQESLRVPFGIKRRVNFQLDSPKLVSSAKLSESVPVNFIHALEASVVHKIASEFDGPLHTNHDCFITSPDRMHDLETIIRSNYAQVLGGENPFRRVVLDSLGDEGYDLLPPAADAVLRQDGSNLSCNFLT